MTQKVPLMIIPEYISENISRPFMGISIRLSNVFSGVKYDLEQTDIDMNPSQYFANVLLNIILFFLLFFILFFALSYFVQSKELIYSLSRSFGYSFVIIIILFIVFLRYPKIIAGKKAEQLDRHLIFALKDLSLQISSGVSLYDSLVNVSKTNYGQVSVELDKAAKSVNSGTPTGVALEKMALGTSSEFLRRTVWQLVNTLRAGASIKEALNSIIDDLTIIQTSKIRDYARELNLWTLIYMLFAVAIPTMGATLLVILASFAGAGVSQEFFIIFILINFAIQYIIIGFVKSRRPVVNI